MKKLVLLALVSLPLPVLAQGGLPDKPYIYVEGKAEIEKPADVVTLRFDLVARNPDQAKANDEVQSKASKILALLNERKIAHSDVIANDLRAEPEREEEDEYSRKPNKIIGYKVTRPFLVKVRDVTVFPKLVNDLIAFGGLEFSAIDSGLADEKPMQDEIWTKALTNARDRAEKALKEVNMKIDSVFAVSPVSFPEIYQRIFSRVPAASYESAMAQGPKRPDPTQYRLAPVTISQGVHVIYLISPAK